VINETDDMTARPRLLRPTPMTLGRLAGLVLGGLRSPRRRSSRSAR
jgi:hypothetical protein